MGWWRKADGLNIHFAESWNEMHHLLIMKALGGNANGFDRFLAKVGAFIYYWILVLVYMVNSKGAYHLMEVVESHAHETYDTFLQENEAALKATPAPDIAINYYRDDELYRFDEEKMDLASGFQRSPVSSLYDVFANIAMMKPSI